MPVKAKATIVRPRQLNGRSPSVSAIIPCYNYGRYLAGCIDSVLVQRDVRIDVLVIDDASSDGSDQIVYQLGKQDTRIRTICHTQNQGAIATYTEGIAQAAGDYTVLLSADDLLTPGCLARATALMEEYPSVGFTYGAPIEFMDGELPAARTAAKSWIVWRGHDWIMQRCRAGGNALKSPEAVIRTSVLRNLGAVRADLPHAADFEAWMRAATVSDVGYVAGADQAYYRIHSNNMHSGYDMIDDLSQRLASFDAIFDERSDLLDDSGSMRDTAHRVIARSALSQAIRDTEHRVLARSALGHAMRAHLRGAAGDEPINDYIAFALKAWPDARDLAEWRTLERLRDAHDGLPRLGPSLVAHMAIRKLGSRFREWRWRQVGT